MLEGYTLSEVYDLYHLESVGDLQELWTILKKSINEGNTHELENTYGIFKFIQTSPGVVPPHVLSEKVFLQTFKNQYPCLFDLFLTCAYG